VAQKTAILPSFRKMDTRTKRLRRRRTDLFEPNPASGEFRAGHLTRNMPVLGIDPRSVPRHAKSTARRYEGNWRCRDEVASVQWEEGQSRPHGCQTGATVGRRRKKSFPGYRRKPARTWGTRLIAVDPETLDEVARITDYVDANSGEKTRIFTRVCINGNICNLRIVRT
jgi:hypothetical protein